MPKTQDEATIGTNVPDGEDSRFIVAYLTQDYNRRAPNAVGGYAYKDPLLTREQLMGNITSFMGPQVRIYEVKRYVPIVLSIDGDKIETSPDAKRVKKGALAVGAVNAGYVEQYDDEEEILEI
jgi:hypothetical protein